MRHVTCKRIDVGSQTMWSSLVEEPDKEIVMALLWMLIAGLVVGAVARLVVPGRQPGGLLMTMVLGVAGSFIAGFVGRGMGFYDLPGHGAGIIASLIGATILLLLYRAVRTP
jgi:uncharacterized membrane protein YeaQ/YmgE (transglycosylase-associated protein family)